MNNYTFLRFQLATGRTHQIRVHMAYLGHPLAGDDMYGGDLQVIQRQALHCEWVRWPDPVTGQLHQVAAPIHQDMQKCLEKGANTGNIE